MFGGYEQTGSEDTWKQEHVLALIIIRHIVYRPGGHHSFRGGVE